MKKKIVHIALTSPYADGWTYHENMLTKAHVQLGYSVTLLTTQYEFGEGGAVINCSCSDYVNEDGVRIRRLQRSLPLKRLAKYRGLYSALEEERPDFIFIHNFQMRDSSTVAKYAKKHSVRIFADNHADYSNSAKSWLSKMVLHGIVWKYFAHKIEPYTTRFFGVLPARVQFMKELYNLPANKCALLVMGADDRNVHESSSEERRNETREKYAVKKDDFLIVTGGKINEYRPETLNLMRAVSDIDSNNLKLCVFGSVSEALRFQFDNLLSCKRIVFCGWKNAQEATDILAAADLAVFPGLHSVIWEQAVALGTPCIFRDINGFHHVDIGGNALFLRDVSDSALKGKIEALLNDSEVYRNMKKVAGSEKSHHFLYSNIALKSIDCD